MGLDNGLIIKKKSVKGYMYLKEHFNHLEESTSKGEFEFGYWRKCWNIRQRFIDVFKNKYDRNEDVIKFEISDIPIIINDVLKYFLNADNWEYNDSYSHVFNWYEELPSIAQAINNLYFFLSNIDEYSITDEDVEIFFYDSY